MQVLLTGAANPTGRAVLDALLAAGHTVRAFGVTPDEAAALPTHTALTWFPGRLDTPGSIEPVLSQRDAIVHAACLDAPGKDKVAHAIKIERGTLYTRYGAEREMVDLFVHLHPADAGRYATPQANALASLQAMRGNIPLVVVAATDPATAAKAVLAALPGAKSYGLPPGKQAAVTA